MINMVRRDYLPAVEKYMRDLAATASKKRALLDNIGVRVETDLIRRLTAFAEEAYRLVDKLEEEEEVAAKISDGYDKAREYADKILPLMDELRAAVDGMEPLTAAEYWPVATYGDLMFGV